MTQITFFNGQFTKHENCFVHIGDRGLQFADGAYEVILLDNGKIIDSANHLLRFERSLQEISLPIPYSSNNFQKIFQELIAKNNLQNGSIYLQATRGASVKREAHFPKNLEPTIIAYIQEPITSNKTKFSAITCADLRWGRCDIKSTNLLANSLAKQNAINQNCDEAIFTKNGQAIEASFANLFIVDSDDNLITPDLSHNILSGVTRGRIIKLAQENNLKIIEGKISEKELFDAKEVFVTSSTLLIRPIVQINGKMIDAGEIGQITQKISALYQGFLKSAS